MLKALPLHKRIPFIKPFLNFSAIDENETSNCDLWREDHPLKNAERWQAKLSELKINEIIFNAIVSSPGNFSEKETTELNLFLEKILAISAKGNLQPFKANSKTEIIDFSNILLPLTEYCRINLKKIISDKNLFDDSLIENQVAAFDIKVKREIAPAIIQEYNNLIEQNKLKGNLPGELFHNFTALTSTPKWIEFFFRKYPVLLLWIDTFCNFSIANFQNIVSDFENGYSLLVHEDFIKHGGEKVCKIDYSAGDAHNNGQSATIIEFNSGNKIVFKPRKCENEILFEHFSKWLESTGYTIKFSHPKILQQNEYSWVKYIEHSPCKTKEEVGLFYERQGAYLCILYFLGAEDLINDNIIANGEFPVLIDLECLFSPSVRFSKSQAGKKFFESVIRIGMLPSWAAADKNNPGINLGGLSKFDANKILEKYVWVFNEDNFICQKIIRTELVVSNNHLPILHNEIQEISKYTEEFFRGFITSYKFFIRNKKKLFAKESVLNLFKGQKTRLLFRHTNVYSRINNEARHPDYLTDSLKKDHLLDYYWAAFDKKEMPAAIIQSEIEQIWNNDIPYFYSMNDTHSVSDPQKKLVDNFFDKSGFEASISRIKNADEHDLKFQLSVIEQSFTIFENFNPYENILLRPFAFTDSRSTLSKNDLIFSAEKIASKVLESSIEDADNINWIDISVGHHGEWEQTLKPNGIYDGVDGIGLFFLYLGRITNDKKFSKTAFKILKSSLSQFDDAINENRSAIKGNHSPMLFPSSVIYLLLHAGSLYPNEFDGLKYYTKYYKWLDENLHFDESFDFVNGVAGSIHLLSDLYSNYHHPEARELSIRCADYLIKKSKCSEPGLFWEAKKFKKLGGFAHGNSSYSYTLLRIGKAFNIEKFTSAGQKALLYDQSLFNVKHSAWKDVRNENNFSSCGWCHGSPGVILSRLLVSPYVDNKFIETELNSGLAHVVKHGFSLSHCMCHGQFGNLEILYALAKQTQNKKLEFSVLNHLQQLLADYGNAGRWKCGMSERNIDLFGLFLGLTGIGYALLRFADWENIPSALFLEGPSEKNKRFNISSSFH